MKRVLFSRPSGLLILPVVMLCVSCFKPDDTGFSLIPQDEWVTAEYTDTFTIETRSLIQDSVRTGGASFSLMGQYLDEEFGTISAATFSQFITTGDNVVFGSDQSLLTLDSVMLKLDLVGFYGRYEDPLPLEIFEVTGDWEDTDSLYSNDYIAFDSTKDLGNGYKINFNKLTGFLDFVSIRLDNSIGEKILHTPTDSLVNSAVFSKFFRGLCIRANADPTFSREPGAIYTMDMLSSNTSITIFYHDNGTAKSYALRVKNDTPRYHTFTRSDYDNKLFGLYGNDTTGVAPYNFMECGNLVKLFVKIPYLNNINPVGVNKAELVLKVDPDLLGSEERYDPPGKIYAFHADSTGTKEVGSSIHLDQGVVYDAGTHTYYMELDNNVMQIMNNSRTNYGFIIIPERNGVSVNRAVFGGPGHPELAPKLRVTYTPVPH